VALAVASVTTVVLALESALVVAMVSVIVMAWV